MPGDLGVVGEAGTQGYLRAAERAQSVSGPGVIRYLLDVIPCQPPGQSPWAGAGPQNIPGEIHCR